ncbi:MAG: hypothetical protein KC438_00350 [Thermomicrobiales bacterium]|nr:hypothetical protein [Thermomicrobiales bacterium]MCO5220270.1 hypothetical protein [Thermomicrobiales bacterium]
MASPYNDNAKQRASRARQVISGSDIRPPSSASYPGSPQRYVSYEEEGAMSSPQWIYLGILAALLALAIILYLVFGGGVSSVFFFLLALALFCGWFVF